MGTTPARTSPCARDPPPLQMAFLPPRGVNLDFDLIKFDTKAAKLWQLDKPPDMETISAKAGPQPPLSTCTNHLSATGEPPKGRGALALSRAPVVANARDEVRVPADGNTDAPGDVLRSACRR